MKEVSVYIDTRFLGNFSNGTGKYSIVLEHIDSEGVSKTREHFNAWKETTNHRLPLLACIDALEKFKGPCKISIHINAPYVSNRVNRIDGTTNKNDDLWQKYEGLAVEHEISFVPERRNIYSPAMLMELEIRTLKQKIDRRI